MELPNKTYDIIYADPPWDGLGWNNGSGKLCPANHYPVASPDWIKNLPVQNIANTPSALFLWVTYPNLPLGLEVITSWGFHYSTVAFTWVKKHPCGKFCLGLGNYTRANAEICLLATRGKGLQKWRLSRSVPQLCTAVRGRHSEKPAEIRGRIVELFGDRPRIELFARARTPGWDVWGNEVE